jgi:hypothetical protein
MLRKSNKPYTDRTTRKRWQKAISLFSDREDLMAYLPRGTDLLDNESVSIEASLAEAGVEDITISDILEAHDRWQAESPDDPEAIHRLVDETWAKKRTKKVDVG